MKAQQDQQGMADEQAARSAFMGSGGDQAQYRNALIRAGLVKKVQDLDATDLKNQGGRADIAQKGATTKKTLSDVEAANIARHRDYLSDVNDPQTAMQWAKIGLDSGVLDDQRYQMALQNIQRASASPQAFEQWKAGAALGATKFIEANKPSYHTQGLGDRSQIVATPGLVGAPSVVSSSPINQSADNAAAQATALAGQQNTANIAAAGRAQSAAQFGVTSDLSRERLNFDKTKPPGGAKSGPMSVTLQKELLESDDVVQSAGNVVRTLEAAKAKNKDAYSGYFAKGRATLASNLPGNTSGADATIDIDNMMTGQALESLKVVFGGMPTEGERKILLEMQASVDKTPAQRAAIMDRAIAAAKRRADYAGGKAKAIRGGTYLTEGAEPMAQDAAPAGKTVVRTGKSGGRKVVEYSDGTLSYVD
jgi:hypothetical protein